LRNRDLDARPFNLPASLPQFQRNQFGVNAGGPLRKNRLFGFLSYEGLRVHQAAANLTTVSLPTSLQRQGNFSRDAPIKARATGSPFSENRIPITQINPLSLAGVNAFPLPLSGISYVNLSELLQVHNDNYSGRMDLLASEKWNLFARFSRSNENANIPF